jgi:hypothetical protein
MIFPAGQKHAAATIHAVQSYAADIDEPDPAHFVGAYLYGPYHSGTEWQYSAPVRPGDYCDVTAVEDVREAQREALAAEIERMNRRYVPIDREAPR